MALSRRLVEFLSAATATASASGSFEESCVGECFLQLSEALLGVYREYCWGHEDAVAYIAKVSCSSSRTLPSVDCGAPKLIAHVTPIGTLTQNFHSRGRRFAGLCIPGRDIEFISCSVLVFVGTLTSIYSTLNSILLHSYVYIHVHVHASATGSRSARTRRRCSGTSRAASSACRR